LLRRPRNRYEAGARGTLISGLAGEGKLKIVPAIYDLQTGIVTFFVESGGATVLIPLASAADEIAHVHDAIEELFTRTTAHSGWLHRTPPFQAGTQSPSRATLTVAPPSPH
jgi:hypothetical protein